MPLIPLMSGTEGFGDEGRSRLADPMRDFEITLPVNRLSFTAGGPSLVVSFDNAGAPHREPPDRMAWGHKFFTDEGHSVLGVIAGQSDWFRCPTLHDTLIALRKDGFFRQFSQVTLTGSSMGGFGAAAFASLSPGCNVLSFNPQSTLRDDLVPWETGHPNGRRQDWSGQFSDAAAEARHAGVVYVFFDPFHIEDHRHAARFTGSNVRLMRSPFLGHGLPESYKDMGILKDIMRAGIRGTLDNSWFYDKMRGRKQLSRYYKALVNTLARHSHLRAGESVAERAFKRFNDPFFCQRRAVFLAGMGNVELAFEILDAQARTQRAAKRRRRAEKQG